MKEYKSHLPTSKYGWQAKRVVKKLAVVIILSMVFSVVGIYTPAVHTHTAEAAVYEVEQKSACPEGGEPTAIGAAGCSSCGGRGIYL